MPVQVSDEAGADVLELFTDLEEYIGEAIYSLAKQGVDQSMAETIRQFIKTQVRASTRPWLCHTAISASHCLPLTDANIPRHPVLLWRTAPCSRHRSCHAGHDAARQPIPQD